MSATRPDWIWHLSKEHGLDSRDGPWPDDLEALHADIHAKIHDPLPMSDPIVEPAEKMLAEALAAVWRKYTFAANAVSELSDTGIAREALAASPQLAEALRLGALAASPQLAEALRLGLLLLDPRNATIADDHYIWASHEGGPVCNRAGCDDTPFIEHLDNLRAALLGAQKGEHDGE